MNLYYSTQQSMVRVAAFLLNLFSKIIILQKMLSFVLTDGRIPLHLYPSTRLLQPTVALDLLPLEQLQEGWHPPQQPACTMPARPPVQQRAAHRV